MAENYIGIIVVIFANKFALSVRYVEINYAILKIKLMIPFIRLIKQVSGKVTTDVTTTWVIVME